MGGVRDEIAKNLLYYRKKKGITQKELAEFLDVNNSAVSNWEKGLNSIDIDTLHKACLALNISVSDMFGSFSNMRDTSFTLDETDIIFKYRKLDSRGKKAVTHTLDREYQYMEEQQAEFVADRTDYIKKHALPFASSGGDSSNLAEAQELYDAKRKEIKDGK